MTKTVKKHIEFPYLLTKIQLHTLIVLTLNIFRIQEDDRIMCEFSFIAFMESMLSRKTLLDYTNLFSPNNNRKQ